MDIVLRILFAYVLVMVLFRVMGKRELNAMSPFDLVTLLLIPELLAGAMTRDDTTMTTAVIAVTTLLSLVFLTSVVTYRFARAERLVEGSPTVLVSDGQLRQPALAQERVTVDELFAEMHKVGITRLADVRWAILEADGKIALIRRDDEATRASGGSIPVK